MGGQIADPVVADVGDAVLAVPTGEELEPNEEGIAFYLDLFTEMRRLGIRPLVTLSHYDPPLALALKNNAWVDRSTIALFERFSRTCFERFGHLVDLWLSFNEIDGIIRHPFTSGGIIDETVEGSLEQACYTALHHQFVASASVTRILHELWPESENTDDPQHFGPEESHIVAVIETAPWLEKCRAALGSHRSQVDPNHPFWQFYSIMQELPGSGEAYLLGGGTPFPPSDGPANYLFAGLV